MKRKVNNASSKDKTTNEDGGDYFVEQIVAKKLKPDNGGSGNAKWLYKVKWVNWPNSANTWEPLENLVGSERFVQEFEDCDSKKIGGTYVRAKKKYRNNKEVVYHHLEDSSVSAPAEEVKGHRLVKKIPVGAFLRCIIGATAENGQLFYLIAWEDERRSNKTKMDFEEFSSSSEVNPEKLAFMARQDMNRNHPQAVLKFLEKYVKFVNQNENQSQNKPADATAEVEAAETTEERVDTE